LSVIRNSTDLICIVNQAAGCIMTEVMWKMNSCRLSITFVSSSPVFDLRNNNFSTVKPA